MQGLSAKVTNKKRSDNDRLRAAVASSKAPADAMGYKYPMPWTTKEALANERSLSGLTGTKYLLLSRVASVADATGHRHVTKTSRRDFVKLRCPIPACEFQAKICFRKKGENLINANCIEV